MRRSTDHGAGRSNRATGRHRHICVRPAFGSARRLRLEPAMAIESFFAIPIYRAELGNKDVAQASHMVRVPGWRSAATRLARM